VAQRSVKAAEVSIQVIAMAIKDFERAINENTFTGNREKFLKLTSDLVTAKLDLEFEQSKLKLVQARTIAETAQLDRLAKLVASGVVPQKQFDDAKIRLEATLVEGKVAAERVQNRKETVETLKQALDKETGKSAEPEKK
jgi:hypothetical protein